MVVAKANAKVKQIEIGKPNPGGTFVTAEAGSDSPIENAAITVTKEAIAKKKQEPADSSNITAVNVQDLAVLVANAVREAQAEIKEEAKREAEEQATKDRLNLSR